MLYNISVMSCMSSWAPSRSILIYNRSVLLKFTVIPHSISKTSVLGYIGVYLFLCNRLATMRGADSSAKLANKHILGSNPKEVLGANASALINLDQIAPVEIPLGCPRAR